jgi:4-diphosphocytidyl-2-C-methyl-D-erythritol kinase
VFRLDAPAKINLGLEILGRRDDGFHEIVSVTQTVTLADTLEARPADTLTVEMSPPLVDEGGNLVRRAAELLAAHTGRPPFAHLHISKRVPLAAGLGGGSSDAAAARRLLDRLGGTRVSQDRLQVIAAELGSDVPLFLIGGGSLVRGRGERVTQLPPARPFWLVLVCPEVSPPDKTRALYGALQPSEWSDGTRTLALAEAVQARIGVTDGDLVNGFDGPAARVYPGFRELRARVQQLARRPVHLTGAGPGLFALIPDEREARAAAARVATTGLPTHIARSVMRRPAIRASDG